MSDVDSFRDDSKDRSLQNRPLMQECIFSGHCEPLAAMLPNVMLREFASAKCGATGMSTGTATFNPGARLEYHQHPFSEAVTLLEGEAAFAVEGRRYRLRRFDCIHVPAGVAHEVTNEASQAQMVAHWAFASPTPTRELVNDHFEVENRSLASPGSSDPEYIVRANEMKPYDLAEGTRFIDLFAGRFGSVGICGGYGEFNPGSSLPCHIHDYDESITIVAGEAVCEVKGRQYRLTGCDTAFVPRGRPHRFLNESGKPMAMVWVYSGSEPTRTVLDSGYCTGQLK